MKILEATTYIDELDHYHSERLTAIIDEPSIEGLIKVAESVDELNILIDFLMRDNVDEIISWFGTNDITLKEMLSIAIIGDVDKADIEEIIFEANYHQYVSEKLNNTVKKIKRETDNQFNAVIKVSESPYDALCKIRGDKEVSKEEFEQEVESARRFFIAKANRSEDVDIAINTAILLAMEIFVPENKKYTPKDLIDEFERWDDECYRLARYEEELDLNDLDTFDEEDTRCIKVKRFDIDSLKDGMIVFSQKICNF